MSRAAPGAATRVLAARILAAVLWHGHSLKAELARQLPTLADPRDRALVEAICFEVLRWRRRYEYVLSAWLPRPLPARDRTVQALLLAGLAQLDALRLPAHAALAATAEAARGLRRPNLVGLVNAVLRRATREAWPIAGAEGIDLSHPDWLIDRLRADWPGRVAALLDAGNRPAPMWLRVNPRHGTRADYLARLAQAGIEAIAPDVPAHAIRLDEPLPTARLPGWNEGALSIQDGAAQLAAEALAVCDGERVLDACAAPGGKAAHLLELAPGLALTALDVDAQRLDRVRDTLRRLGLLGGNTRLKVADAADTAAWWDGTPFDAILLDAPCSATGIIRRQPDVKWHRREDDIAALCTVQARLLDALWSTLRPGGRLLYATCSLLRTENAEQIAAFLARTPDAVAQPLDARFGHPDGAGRQRFPGEDGMDGFFYALLRKSG
ncbi:MAG: 16S rRNA (cytosine(967)-C(5))-methyltransferase RsmB [Rehaibacterium terrae]|uniref:16S rRNA (cytosine(967)-C(5))-methyltransferase RsmB n=1 Tax=Rehaibacterium terrae TaxID=1341696 RepID=UPI00391998A3